MHSVIGRSLWVADGFDHSHLIHSQSMVISAPLTLEKAEAFGNVIVKLHESDIRPQFLLSCMKMGHPESEDISNVRDKIFMS